MAEEKKLLTIVIPAYHAEKHIANCLASIQMQTYRDKVNVIISSDHPDDDYEFTKTCYPDLPITIIPCEKNAGPGVARQRGLDACKTDWVTFIDADDVFINPVAIEKLIINTNIPNCIEVQGPFFQEIVDPTNPNNRMLQRNDVTHPWVFGRAYNVRFLKENDIKFGQLRAMEDGQFNWLIRMTIEGSPFKINLIQDPIYLWRTGSEHSITRIGTEENDGIPIYNFDLCQVGATVAAINAIKFCKKKNPFNGGVTRFTVEMFVGHYFTYVECLAKRAIFAEQCLFNAKRFYHACYKLIEDQIDRKILTDMYSMHYAANGRELVGFIPEISFFDFIDRIKSDDYNGKEEFDKIREKLPDWVIECDKKSGVLGDEGYIYHDGEK